MERQSTAPKMRGAARKRAAGRRRLALAAAIACLLGTAAPLAAAPLAAAPLPTPTPTPTPALAPGERVLTLADAWASGLATNEQLQAAHANQQKAAVAPWRAYSAVGPSLSGTASYTREKEAIAFPFANSLTLPGPTPITLPLTNLFGSNFNPVVLAQDVLRSALSVSQPLYTHQFWALRDLGKATVAQSDQAYQAAREDILLAVAAAYYDVLRAQALSAVAQQAKQLAETEVTHAEARVAAGEAVRSDVLRAQTQVARAEERIASTSGLIEVSVDSLRRLAGVQGPFRVVEPPVRSGPPAGVEGLVDSAMQQSPDLQEREAGLSAAQAEERRRQAVLYPTLGVQWTYQNLNHSTFADQNDFWNLMVVAQVPFFDAGGTRFLDIEEQRAVVAGADAQVRGFRRDLEVSVQKSWVSARTLAAQQVSAEKEVALASETYRMLSDQYAAGVATNLDVLSALTSLNDARANLAVVRYARAVALVQLDRVVGTLGRTAASPEGTR